MLTYSPQQHMFLINFISAMKIKKRYHTRIIFEVYHITSGEISMYLNSQTLTTQQSKHGVSKLRKLKLHKKSL